MLQFSKGGPIIAFQVENEYGSTEKKGKFVPDRTYLRQLRQLMINNGIVELLVTSDSPSLHGSIGTLPGVFLQTANFASNPEYEFRKLKRLQPNRPIMAMEFWSGWFDHWSEVHHVRSDDSFADTYERILKYPASVNIYMFHGGTSFGFMNGANLENSLTDNSGYQPDTTSYDYDSPLTESGDYTVKYVLMKELLRRYNPVLTRIPQTPHQLPKIVYDPAPIDGQLLLDEMLEGSQKIFSENLMSMELLPINNMSGQSYGYIVYRRRFLDMPARSVLTIGGRICDSLVVLINGELVSKPLNVTNDLNGFGFWRLKDSKLHLRNENLQNATLDLVVENWGRNNFGYLDQFNQFKGLWQGSIYLNKKEIKNWLIIPLEFRKWWTNQLSGWHKPNKLDYFGPSLYKTSFFVNETIDTYLDMRNWCKGIVIINGFVLGRYSRIGPQQTLYLPGPFLKVGWNNVIIYEHYYSSDRIVFSNRPIYETRTNFESLTHLRNNRI
nr:beta-galactosidase-1-like protein 2 isoform X1 [Leptinotarsa decemlineata]